MPKLWTLERYQDFRAPAPVQELDRWWLASFRRLLERERRGGDPRALDPRWQVLSRFIGRRTGPRLSFEPPDFIVHILDDADVRAKDPRYAEGQWQTAENWFNA